MTLALMGMDSLHFAESKVSQGREGWNERGIKLLQSLGCLHSPTTPVFDLKEKRFSGIIIRQINIRLCVMLGREFVYTGRIPGQAEKLYLLLSIW